MVIISGAVNHHFIPSDLLLYLIYDGIEGENCVSLSLILRDIFDVHYSPKDIIEMVMENCTLREFFNEVVKLAEHRVD